jgi:hypothetical protein
MGRANAALALADMAAQLFRPTEPAQIAGATYPTYRRSDFRSATRLHTFAFVIEVPPSDTEDLAALAALARKWARKHKGGIPAGMGSGTAAMPVFVAPEISSEVWEWASSPQPVRFASGLFPIVVTSDGQFAAYRRHSATIGIFYEAFLRQLAGRLLRATDTS